MEFIFEVLLAEAAVVAIRFVLQQLYEWLGSKIAVPAIS